MKNYLSLKKQWFCLNWKNNLNSQHSMIMISNYFVNLGRIDKQIIRKIRINLKATILKNLNHPNLRNSLKRHFQALISSTEIFNDITYMNKIISIIKFYLIKMFKKAK